MNKTKMISIVVPVYNEEKNIRNICNSLVKLFSKNRFNYEIIFVDDKSIDKTVDMLEELHFKNNNIKFIEMSRRFGYQESIFAGLKYSSGDAVITMDADFEHPPELIDKMIIKWEQGFDVVNMVRDSYNQKSILFNIFSKLFYKTINYLSDIKLVENSADFRLLNRKVVDIIISMPEKNIFLRGLVSWIGFNQCNITYTQNKRAYGKTKFNFLKSISLATDGLTSFTASPLYLSIYIGFFISIIGFIYSSWIIFNYFTKINYYIQGWSTIVCLQLIIGGLVLIFFGIIGLYLAKIFEEVKNRPLYMINKMRGFRDQ